MQFVSFVEVLQVQLLDPGDRAFLFELLFILVPEHLHQTAFLSVSEQNFIY